MKRKLLITLFCITAISFASAQSNNADFQSDPKLVMEEVFRAAKTGDYSNLHLLCPPDGSNDGDTRQYICEVVSGSDELKKEFTSYFKVGHVSGEVTYNPAGDRAEVPFWFNHPSGESRSNETMNMLKIDDKWYLHSF